MKLEHIKGKKGQRGTWKTLEEHRFNIGPWCNPRVPAGFESNLGTIPRGFYWLVAPDDYPQPFIEHDWLCNEDADPTDDEGPHNSGFSRWIADAILYERLKKYGVPAWKCWIVWIAVRSFARTKGLK